MKGLGVIRLPTIFTMGVMVVACLICLGQLECGWAMRCGWVGRCQNCFLHPTIYTCQFYCLAC